MTRILSILAILAGLSAPAHAETVNQFTAGDGIALSGGGDAPITITNTAPHVLYDDTALVAADAANAAAIAAHIAADLDTDPTNETISDLSFEARCVATGRERRTTAIEGGVSIFGDWEPAPAVYTHTVAAAGAYTAIPTTAIANGECFGDRFSIEVSGARQAWVAVTGLFSGTFRTVTAVQIGGNHATNYMRGQETLEAVWNGSRWVTSWEPDELSGTNWYERTDGTVWFAGGTGGYDSTAAGVTLQTVLYPVVLSAVPRFQAIGTVSSVVGIYGGTPYLANVSVVSVDIARPQNSPAGATSVIGIGRIDYAAL